VFESFTDPLVLSIPTWYVYIFVFAIGAAIGSFLNVCIYRIPQENMNITSPRRSQCPACKNEIRWYDNIPLFSYLWLSGRCRSCKQPISLRYPLVELISAVLAIAVLKRFGLQPVSLVWFALICALIVITFIDLEHWIIPDIISLPSIPLGIGFAALIGSPMPNWRDAVIGAFIGGGVFFIISKGYELIRRQPGMGLGDAKLLAMLGAFLGWKALPLLILLASAQGLIATLVLYAFGWREGVPDDLLEDEETSSVDAPNKARFDTAKPSSTGEELHADNPDQCIDQDDAKPTLTQDEQCAENSEVQEVGIFKTAIPFGPFLSLAAIEVLFWGDRIYQWVANILVGVGYPNM
jgi:leader peptidase (prepilin peptidase)/N-methyltransferase